MGGNATRNEERRKWGGGESGDGGSGPMCHASLTKDTDQGSRRLIGWCMGRRGEGDVGDDRSWREDAEMMMSCKASQLSG